LHKGYYLALILHLQYFSNSTLSEVKGGPHEELAMEHGNVLVLNQAKTGRKGKKGRKEKLVARFAPSVDGFQKYRSCLVIELTDSRRMGGGVEAGIDR
jgi:hypothetical protein